MPLLDINGRTDTEKVSEKGVKGVSPTCDCGCGRSVNVVSFCGGKYYSDACRVNKERAGE